MFEVHLGLVVGLLAGLTAGWALVATYRRPLEAPGAPEELLRAFKRLEADFEELQERVLSQLGRISRLKRDMLPGATQSTAGAEGDGTRPPKGQAPAANPPMTRSRLLALARTKGVRTYAEEQDSSGTDGR